MWLLKQLTVCVFLTQWTYGFAFSHPCTTRGRSPRAAVRRQNESYRVVPVLHCGEANESHGGFVLFNIGGDHYLCDVCERDFIRDGTEWSCIACFDTRTGLAEGPCQIGFDACNHCYEKANDKTALHPHELTQGGHHESE